MTKPNIGGGPIFVLEVKAEYSENCEQIKKARSASENKTLLSGCYAFLVMNFHFEAWYLVDRFYLLTSGETYGIRPSLSWGGLTKKTKFRRVHGQLFFIVQYEYSKKIYVGITPVMRV